MKFTMRWTAKLKQEVLILLAAGKLTEREAQQLYGLSAEELAQWQRLFDAHGVKGLRARHLHSYRSRPAPVSLKIIAARKRARHKAKH